MATVKLHSQFLITSGFSGLGCALQANSDKVPLTVPYTGVLQRPLAAGHYRRAAVVLR